MKKKKSILYIKPEKTKEEIPIEEINNGHRNFDCIFYDHCLNHAFIFRYKGFICKNCKDYIKI